MKITGRPVRTTILFGLLAALAFVPAMRLLSLCFPWTAAFRLVVGLTVALYGLLLARWAGTRISRVALPLLLLLFLAGLIDSGPAFFLVSVVALSWVRSGVCFPKSPLRMLALEVLIAAGGGVLVLSLRPFGASSWALGLWMFFLVQSVYFVLSGEPGRAEAPAPDPFDQARSRLERILRGEP